MTADRVKEMVQEGLRRKLSGDLNGAAQAWLEALRLDPTSTRARDGLAALSAAGFAVPDESFREPPPAAGSLSPLGMVVGLQRDLKTKLSPERAAPAKSDVPWQLTPEPFDARAAASSFQPTMTPLSMAAPSEKPLEPSFEMESPKTPIPRSARASGFKPDSARPSPQGGSQTLMFGFQPPTSSGKAREDDPRVLLLSAIERLDLDDHTGALEAVERVLELEPGNATALELKNRCQNTLLTMFESKIGDLSIRPRVLLRPEEVVWLNLDPRAGFVLSLIDGHVSYADLFAISSMSRLETARILAALIQDRVIG